jgi:methylmalonyl-CoA mutase
VAGHEEGLCRRRVRGQDPRQGNPHRPDPRDAFRHPKIRKVALPRFEDEGELLKFLMRENVPGSFPYTAGVFAFKRENEDPTRMFAGEGDAFRTNKRFLKVSEGMPAKRLSTAFDSVTLYGCDPDPRPDIYGKVGNSGVSIATLDDLKVLYSGFDLCDPATSVSMTINGPAPMILAMFLNAAIDQQIAKFVTDNSRQPTEDEAEKIREWTLSSVRGTVQADILKEDQGQNTCIFSTEFALKMMGDIAEFFVHNQIRNFYSVSISGYHIAEAGANPISQLAFTLANGFTYCRDLPGARHAHRRLRAQPELLLQQRHGPGILGDRPRRAPHLGRGDEEQVRRQRAQPEAQVPHPDLRPQPARAGDGLQRHPHHAAGPDRHLRQLQQPAHQRLRRGHHHADRGKRAPRHGHPADHQPRVGRGKEREPEPGRLHHRGTDRPGGRGRAQGVRGHRQRGGVLGAMETGYQRGKIQEESMTYEHRKHDGSYPIIGVNTFLNPHGSGVASEIELARSTDDEKQSQLTRLKDFQQRNASQSEACLAKLRQAVIDNDNVFAVMMEAVRHCSLGQISNALYLVGGQYRRSM